MLVNDETQRPFEIQPHDFCQSSENQSGHYSQSNPAGIYLLKVNIRNTRTRFEICPKLITKTPERRR